MAFLRALWYGLSQERVHGHYELDVIQHCIVIGLVFEQPRYSEKIKGVYAAIHNAARIELYHASSGVALKGSRGVNCWRRALGPVTPAGQEPSSGSRAWWAEGAASSDNAALADLAAVVNKMTGTILYPGLGISEAQEAVERRLVLPRYLRCLLGLLTDAVQGRIRGNESRRLLFHCALAATVVYILLS